MKYLPKPRIPSPLPTGNLTPAQFSRHGLILSMSVVEHLITLLEALPNLPPEEQAKAIRETRPMLLSTLGGLTEVEIITRPKLVENDDLGWLKTLFSLPDMRSESPITQ